MSLSGQQASVLRDLTDGRRIGVVRAGPGCGKTRVFAELFRQEMLSWRSPPGGIAALSFTNVAQREIANRLQNRPAAPHFVGTLDAFMWRYVVRPFGRLAGVSEGGAVLIPAPLDQLLDEPKTRVGSNQRDVESIYRLTFLKGTERDPQVARRDPYGRQVLLADPFRRQALVDKKKNWGRTGRLTHSDCQYLAACILQGPYGVAVVSLLARRFPVVLVDEFQDTGWFLGRALLKIVESPSVRSVLVGDPDQSIYKFGGADRALFGQMEALGQKPPLSLLESHRCSSRICDAASVLSRSRQRMTPLPGAPSGDAYLLRHWQDRSSVSVTPILEVMKDLLTEHECHSIGVLARKTETANRLKATTALNGCPWGSGTGRKLSVAVEQIMAGEFSRARAIVERELGQLIFRSARGLPATLRQVGISPEAWRLGVNRILLDLARTAGDETWNQWIEKAKASFLREATQLGQTPDRTRLGARFKRHANGDAIRVDPPSSPPTIPLGTEVLTVHQAKGRTFDAVVFYVPKTAGPQATCPSDDWWSEEPGSEEQEIAFVACSRPRRLLVIAAHDTVCANLRAKRADFHAQFRELLSRKSRGREWSSGQR